MKKGNYTYILQCADGTLYTGWTNDPERRLRMHQQGKASKYTRSRLPVHMVYLEEHLTKQEAMKREYEIKQLQRAKKLQLIGHSHCLEHFLKERIHNDAMAGASGHNE